jgi:hypothetical protein
MLVFQYGSNASERRINAAERLQGDARLIGAFETSATYAYGFTVWSDDNKCAAASIAPGHDPAVRTGGDPPHRR